MESPLTGSTNVKLLGTSSPAAVGARWRSGFDIDVGADFLSLPKIEYWRCQDTGFHWYSPAEAAGGAGLYSQLEKFDWYYMPDKWEFRAALERMHTGDEVLEVGVGFGFFLDKCRAKGVNAVGVELNHFAAKRVCKKGFQVYEYDLDRLADRRGANGYDVVCSFQVLEHAAAPRAFLSGMLRNLRIGGRLILSVPNAAVIRRVDPKNQDLLNQPPHHMSHWDTRVFQSLNKYFPVRLRFVAREPLAKYHTIWVLIGFFRGLFPGLGPKAARLLFNRFTLLPLSMLLNAGLRKRIPGHTLLVELEKV